MAYGIIGYSQPNALTQPSGAIWGDCSSIELLDEGSGYFTFKTFVDDVTLPGLPSSAANAGTFTQDANFDHALLITTGTTANNGAIIFTEPTVSIVPNSGQKVWFEANISLPSITSVKGIFVGLANKVAQTNALVKAASATAASNLLTSVALSSVVGFWSHGDALTNFDAVWVNKVAGTGGLEPASAAASAAASVNTVLANVLTANANNPNPANLGYVPALPPGVLAANTQVKLGLRYDGIQYLYFYVNGTQVAKMLISAAFDITSTFGAVVAIATGTAAASTVDVNFFRSASLLFA